MGNKIILDAPTLFYGIGKKTDITENGRFFYSCNGSNYTLPKGVYEFTGDAPKALMSLPTPKIPIFAFGGILETNGIAWINIKSKPPIVWFNKGFYESASKCDLAFVLMHELGHIFNGRNEKGCDRYAYKKCIEMGYNQSQIFATAQKTLGFDKERLIQMIKKTTNK